MKKKFLLLFLFISCIKPVAIEEDVDPDKELSSSPNNSTQTQSQDSGGDDPLLVFQWHLENTGKYLGVSGVDTNSRSIYDSGNKGAGVTVAVVDDGLEMNHEDLAANISSSLSYNYVNSSNNPTPSSDSGHGTSCAGIIAARDLNGKGGRGIAPRATLVGFNLLANYSDANARDSMRREKNKIDISNNSWGPADGYGTFTKPDSQWKLGVEEGVDSGRGGKGIVYVFAAGNGGNSGDISNYDGFASHPSVMAVAAIGNQGKYASYSELGSNIWISAPSMGNNAMAVTTTDLMGKTKGYNKGTGDELSDNNYTKKFNGTSAAAPMVSGVAALVLKENPNLSNRDVKNIIAKSARKIDPSNVLWDTNGAEVDINYSYGFGLVDAEAAVQLASTWSNLPTQIEEQWPVVSSQTVNTAILDNGTVLEDDIVVAGSGISNIEFVEVEVNIDHADWGNLTIFLERQGAISTRSVLALKHDCYNFSSSNVDCTVSGNTFTFGVARHLDEPADGTWRIEVRDDETDTIVGELLSWRLKVYGH